MLKKRFFYILCLVFACFIFASCEFNNPQFKGVSHLKIDHINTKEMVFKLDVTIHNPNNYRVNIRPSTLDLYLDDLYIGKASLIEKYKMKKYSTTTAPMTVKVILNRGVYSKLLRLALGNKLTLRLVGPLKVGVAGLGFRKKINEEKQLNLKKLGINLRDLFLK